MHSLNWNIISANEQIEEAIQLLKFGMFKLSFLFDLSNSQSTVLDPLYELLRSLFDTTLHILYYFTWLFHPLNWRIVLLSRQFCSIFQCSLVAILPMNLCSLPGRRNHRHPTKIAASNQSISAVQYSASSLSLVGISMPASCYVLRSRTR